MKRSRGVLLALSLSVLLISTARLSAGTLNPAQIPTFKMHVQGSPTEWDYTPSAAAYVRATGSDGGYKLSYAPHYDGVCDNTTNVSIEQLQFNSDPFVLNNSLVTNTTATTQIYSVTVGLVTSLDAPNLISGNITTSVIDGGVDGATVSTVSGQPIYMAQIDFNLPQHYRMIRLASVRPDRARHRLPSAQLLALFAW